MKVLIYILPLFICFGLKAQNKLDSKFIQHLVNKGEYPEVLFLLEEDHIENDSIHYFEGWTRYAMKDLEPSIHSFLKVSEQSPFYFKSQFFAGYNCSYLSDYSQSKLIFSTIQSENKTIRTLRDFQLLGIDLLNYRYSEAEKKFVMLDAKNPILFQPILNLQAITEELRRHKTKSPVLAGILSAIVPGLGKVYAGRTGEGIASFIATVGFGFMTWENYQKLGPKHVKTIAFGTVFTANYISNIYGSAIRTKIIEDDYQTVMHNQILFNLHIPLRNFFE
ncbi:MAG: hypothetical protein PF541_14730 [Prolixibacteraceae bacterium]|jgi:hypothetical protein|nr:hypothetical protein [Prolixibacteraceae bacterium]